MPEKTAVKTKKKTYIRCKKCGEEIFSNTHKKITYCKCESVAVDGCDDYIRIIGEKNNYRTIYK